MSVALLLFFLFPFVLVIWAQRRLTRAYARAAAVGSRNGCTGHAAVQMILRAARIRDVELVVVGGTLTDYYDPNRRRLALSLANYRGAHLAALAIAAHEAGHAIQQRLGSGLIDFRQVIAVVAQVGAPLGYVLAACGFVGDSMPLVLAGATTLGVVAAIQLYTLPIELDASRRAMAALLQLGIISRAELPAVRSLLSAALVVYLASLVSFVAPLVDLFVRCFDSRRSAYAQLQTR